MRIQVATDPITLDEDLLVFGDNAPALEALPESTFDLIYLDPPFNTGRTQARRTLTVAADEEGDRTGFGGRRYSSTLLQTLSYDDAFSDYLEFLEPRLTRSHELLAPHGTLYFTSTTARRITASCCWTRSSAAKRF